MAIPERPRIRPIEALPFEEKGERIFLLRDPLGYSDQTIGLSVPAALIVSLCDGTRTLRDLQADFARATGEILFTEVLKGLLEKLDAAFFLDSDRYAARRREVEEAYANAPVRAAAHAGASYPADPAALRSLLHDWIDGVGEGLRESIPPRAIIAPHIDLRVGGRAAGRAYAALETNQEAEVFFVLGTAHAGPDAPFVLTRKAYDTPLGPLPTDEGLVGALARRLPFDPFADELVHRNEHSIEFQIVFLRALADRRGGEGRRLRAVPILCGSLHEAVESRRLPEEDARIRQALEALRETVESVGARGALIAGADLSHVGLRFGDEGGVTTPLRAAFEASDQSALEAAKSGDAAGFYRSIAANGDRYRCCGLTPIYAVLRAASSSAGRMLAYEQMNDETGTVSFASVALS